MSELLFHFSWWILAAAVGGIAAFIVGNRRLDKKLQKIGIAVVVVAVVLGLLRFFFPTAREQMETRTRALVRAVDHKDWNALNSLLDANTAVCNRTRVLVAGRNNIVQMTRDNCEHFRVQSVMVLGIESQRADTTITVSVEVYSEQDPTLARAETSSWQLDYQQSGDNWVLEKITLLRIGAEGGDLQNFNPSAY
ncbi:MAG: hypothetical protein ABSD28_10410 [Tepidisphaeraceae bacterium]|jgi:hypothetical protein